MRVSTAGAGLAVALIGLYRVAPVEAQRRVEVGPLVGVYAPLGSFPSAAYYSTGLPSTPEDLSGVTVGGQARVWFRSRAGVQFDGAVAFSRVGGGGTPGGNAPAVKARLFTGSVQFLYRLNSSESGSRMWLSAGGGVVHSGGAAYAAYQGRTHAAGVVGFGSTIPVSRRLAINAGLTTFVYRLNIRDASGVRVEGGSQFDARLQTGLTWSWQ